MVTREKLTEVKGLLMDVCDAMNTAMTKAMSAIDILIAEAPPEKQKS